MTGLKSKSKFGTLGQIQRSFKHGRQKLKVNRARVHDVRIMVHSLLVVDLLTTGRKTGPIEKVGQQVMVAGILI